jgi:hypothetical protein
MSLRLPVVDRFAFNVTATQLPYDWPRSLGQFGVVHAPTGAQPSCTGVTIRIKGLGKSSGPPHIGSVPPLASVISEVPYSAKRITIQLTGGVEWFPI